MRQLPGRREPARAVVGRKNPDRETIGESLYVRRLRFVPPCWYVISHAPRSAPPIQGGFEANGELLLPLLQRQETLRSFPRFVPLDVGPRRIVPAGPLLLP